MVCCIVFISKTFSVTLQFLLWIFGYLGMCCLISYVWDITKLSFCFLFLISFHCMGEHNLHDLNFKSIGTSIWLTECGECFMNMRRMCILLLFVECSINIFRSSCFIVLSLLSPCWSPVLFNSIMGSKCIKVSNYYFFPSNLSVFDSCVLGGSAFRCIYFYNCHVFLMGWHFYHYKIFFFHL